MIPFPILSSTEVHVQQRIKDIQSPVGAVCGILMEDGSLYMRGSNTFYNLGNGTNVDSFKTWHLVRTDVDRLFLGDGCTMVLTKDRKLFFVGDNRYMGGTGNQTEWLNISTKYSSQGITAGSIKDIQIGQFSLFFHLNSDDLYGVGRNGWGEIGTGNTSEVKSPVRIGTVTFLYHQSASTFIIQGGALRSCGRNGGGILGRNSTNSFLPTFGDCTIRWTGDIVSMNETGNGSLLLTDTDGEYNLYGAGAGTGAGTSPNVFTRVTTLSSETLLSNSMPTSGAQNGGNVITVNTGVAGTGAREYFSSGTGMTTTTRYDSVLLPNNTPGTSVTHLVPIRNNGTYIVFNNQLWATQVGDLWFDEKKSGWILQKMPTHLGS